MATQIVRLGPGDRGRATRLFGVMAEVFGEEATVLEGRYVAGLLANPSFWAYAALVGGDVVGGLTAHVIPLTRSMASELMVYDLAVREDHQRGGLGRSLMLAAIDDAAAAGLAAVFVPAENADVHALAFYEALGGVPGASTIFTFNTAG